MPWFISKNEALKKLNNSVTYNRGVLSIRMAMRMEMFNFA